MGASRPKQFLLIGGKAILQITIEKFISAIPDIKIITVLPKGHFEWWKNYCLARNFTCPQTFVEGGITRFHSVGNALKKVPDGALVAVHDGVRPLITVEGIQGLFDVAEETGSAIPVMPCIDTMKPLRSASRSADAGAWKTVGAGAGKTAGTADAHLEIIPDTTVDRSILYAAQTPQIFRSELLKEAYRQPFDTAFTDDASVVERQNKPLSYVEGERLNIKITTKEDLVLAKAIMGSR